MRSFITYNANTIKKFLCNPYNIDDRKNLTMTITPEDEESFIKKELEWQKKQADEKLGEFKSAERRWREAQFRADITQKALDDFYINNPKERNDDNTN